MSKHPNCQCGTPRFEYFRKRYRNNTLHLLRKCPQCGKIAQNPLRQDEYDRTWVESLQIERDGVMEQPVQSRIPAPKPKPRVQSRADAIMKKLQNHIHSR